MEKILMLANFAQKSPLISPIKAIVQHFFICQSERALLGWLGKAPAVTANLASRRCLDSSTASIFFIPKDRISHLLAFDKNACLSS
jgi:hypothetical protein